MRRLLILGVFALISTSKGDVKHVIDGSVHPPPCYQDHQHYHPTPDSQPAVPGSVPFWWADADSPFKQAYEYFKKCSSKSDCLPPVAPSFQVPEQKVSNDIEPAHPGSFENNPFLNGQISDVGHPTPKIDLSRNPFLNTGMQAAYASTGQAVSTGAEGFLGVQPAVPFGSASKAQPFPVSYPHGDQQKPSFASQHPNQGGQPFPSAYPSCAGGEKVCVPSQLCVNGIVSGHDSDCTPKLSDGHCEAGKLECCRFANGGAYSGSTSFQSSFSTSSNFSNLSHIANGKTSSSDSLIKFNGGTGISPGSIQIISDDEPIPNPLLTPGVKGGSNPINKIKVIRNTYSNNAAKPVFASTIDYTNDKLGDLSFDAAFQGPQYLPPLDGTPPPVSYTPELIPPSYQPASPTTHRPPPTSRPQFTYPIASQPSFVSPFVTSKPTASNEYLPPYPSTKPNNPPVHIPTDTQINNQYVVPTVTNTPPHVIYTPKPVSSHPTPGYQSHTFTYPKPSTNKPTQTYPTPGYQSPTFAYPKPSTNQPIQSRPTPGYQYPEPSPAFTYPKPSTNKPTQTPFINPKPSTYKPTEIGGGSNINNQFVSRPSSTTRPPTAGYSYPTPTPTFGYPSRPTYKPAPFKPPVNVITNGPTKNGYSYPTPRPTFTYSPESSNIGNVYQPKPSQSTVNHVPSPNEPIGSVASLYGGCAAALKCVQEIYCTAEGMISPTPVVLTKEQEHLRVPTTNCFDRQAGVVGKCCRDPFYVDPWPSANLVNGFDDGQYKEDPRLGQYFAQKPRPARSGPIRNSQVETCGVRNPNIPPRGENPLEVNFAEIPWQAMVLRDTNRSLLCGGAIVKPNAVLTAAHCVEGLDTRDILVKGGEWKLGIDEEPLPFQIVKVAAVIRHPAYTPGSLKNDLALLMLDERLRTAKNIAPLCLPQQNQQLSGNCIATGWGKQILQLHLRGAIMRSIDVNLLDSNTCTQKLQSKYQNVLPDFSESVICADSNSDHCDVDYGSALACTNGNGQYTLAGIFSWETGCKDKDQIGGYIPPDMQWIETTCAKSLRELKAIDKQYHQ